MVINRMVVLVLGEQGQLQIICGGEMTAGEGVNACRAAADWFQAQVVDAEVRRRVEEQVKGNGDRPLTVDRRPEGKALSHPPLQPIVGEAS